MPPKFAQDKSERDRTRDPNVPKQPHVFTAAELPYRVNAIPPSRSAQFSNPKGASSTATPSASASHYNIPYRQRLVAAALAAPEDPHSSNDSSSAPSSNAVSSSVATSVTSVSSYTASKGKTRATATEPIIPVPSIVPTAAAPVAEATEIDPNASYFELLMVKNALSLPEPGQSYFERRRAIWKTMPPVPATPSSPSPSRIKLEALLSQPGAVESDEVWRAGLKNVWKGLVGGNQLRKRLPLTIVLKILQAGWLRDGTWPEGMVAPSWDQPMGPSSAPPDDPSHQMQGQTPAQLHAQQQRRAHEQEAYAAALHARASAERASGSAQMMHMQAYAMMGLQGGIPPGYSPSSGDAPEEGYYAMPYAYAETTPPPGENAPEGQTDRMEGQEPTGGGQGREGEDVPPLTPLHQGQGVELEMDTEDEAGELEEEEGGDASRIQGVVGTGDGRHEGG